MAFATVTTSGWKTKKQERTNMTPKSIMKIFRETAYVRMGGSAEEKRTARYIADRCTRLGLNAKIEEFPVDMATLERLKGDNQVLSSYEIVMPKLADIPAASQRERILTGIQILVKAPGDIQGMVIPLTVEAF